MPIRVVAVLVGAIVVIAIAAVLLLPGSNDEPTVEASVRSGADNPPPPFATAPDVAAGPATQPPVAVAAPQEPAVDAALAADLTALAAARGMGEPAASAAATPVGASAVDNRITFTLRVAIAAGEYELDGERDVILPGLEAFACDDGACFEVTPAAIAAACADPELGPLIQRGAVVRYRYVDLADEDLGDVTIAAANCVA